MDSVLFHSWGLPFLTIQLQKSAKDYLGQFYFNQNWHYEWAVLLARIFTDDFFEHCNCNSIHTITAPKIRDEKQCSSMFNTYKVCFIPMVPKISFKETNIGIEWQIKNVSPSVLLQNVYFKGLAIMLKCQAIYLLSFIVFDSFVIEFGELTSDQ